MHLQAFLRINAIDNDGQSKGPKKKIVYVLGAVTNKKPLKKYF